jgi:hypothetical protein
VRGGRGWWWWIKAEGIVGVKSTMYSQVGISWIELVFACRDLRETPEFTYLLVS